MEITFSKLLLLCICVLVVSKVTGSNPETYVIETLDVIGPKLCEEICKETKSCVSTSHNQTDLSCQLLGSSGETDHTSSNNTLEGACFASQRQIELKNKDKVCIVTDCGQLSNVSLSSTANFPSTTTGSVGTHSCIEGYSPVSGTMNSTCLSTGMWSPATLQCNAGRQRS